MKEIHNILRIVSIAPDLIFMYNNIQLKTEKKHTLIFFNISEILLLPTYVHCLFCKILKELKKFCICKIQILYLQDKNLVFAR